MEKRAKRARIFVLAILVSIVLASQAYAAMGALSGGMMVGGMGMFGNGPMMANSPGGFGMMNGMAGTPAVGNDGTAYVVSYTATSTPGTAPGSNAFESTILAVTPMGQTTSLKLNGIVSRPVVEGSLLVATASLPNFNDYMMVGNLGVNQSTAQSVLYAITLPLTAAATPVAISLDGSYASVPVIANNRVYVTTTDFGSAMMGNGPFSMYGNYNFNAQGTAKTYLYIINLDGTPPVKVEIQ